MQTGEVAAATQSIAAIAEENSAATEEVLASAEEMGSQIDGGDGPGRGTGADRRGATRDGGALPSA